MHLVTALLYSGKWIGFIPGCLLYIMYTIYSVHNRRCKDYWYIDTCNTPWLTIEQQEIRLSHKTF